MASDSRMPPSPEAGAETDRIRSTLNAMEIVACSSSQSIGSSEMPKLHGHHPARSAVYGPVGPKTGQGPYRCASHGHPYLTFWSTPAHASQDDSATSPTPPSPKERRWPRPWPWTGVQGEASDFDR